MIVHSVQEHIHNKSTNIQKNYTKIISSKFFPLQKGDGKRNKEQGYIYVTFYVYKREIKKY